MDPTFVRDKSFKKISCEFLLSNKHKVYNANQKKQNKNNLNEKVVFKNFKTKE